jgi:pimeloyl-ACP methyl ester carboxylesterase
MTSYAMSADGTRIAYDVSGAGPPLVLLHGGGQTRRVWHDAGYVARLRDQFRVIAVDIRGNGESDKPATVDRYAIERHCDDILAVADAVQARQFSLWGYSYGGNIGRYLPARSDRVTRAVIIGIGFGAAAPAPFRDYILGLRAKWAPLIEADRAGRLDLGSLTEPQRALWEKGQVPLTVAQLSAILDWPPVEPVDLRCSTLWLVGTANDSAVASVKDYAGRLDPTTVVLQLLPGLTHAEELTKIDDVLPLMLAFTRSRGH